MTYLMQYGEELSLNEFELALKKHGRSYKEVKDLNGFSASEIWYVKDSIYDEP